ncbi:uncharacterized protein LOC135811424 [Sycon ciliatum]|uniref:uncharacterized protein LOC135811424 n=1 Tax=Sycon ciliatum TaxID=27933 RepID=UPI0031F6DA19
MKESTCLTILFVVLVVPYLLYPAGAIDDCTSILSPTAQSFASASNVSNQLITLKKSHLYALDSPELDFRHGCSVQFTSLTLYIKGNCSLNLQGFVKTYPGFTLTMASMSLEHTSEYLVKRTFDLRNLQLDMCTCAAVTSGTIVSLYLLNSSPQLCNISASSSTLSTLPLKIISDPVMCRPATAYLTGYVRLPWYTLVVEVGDPCRRENRQICSPGCQTQYSQCPMQAKSGATFSCAKRTCNRTLPEPSNPPHTQNNSCLAMSSVTSSIAEVNTPMPSWRTSAITDVQEGSRQGSTTPTVAGRSRINGSTRASAPTVPSHMHWGTPESGSLAPDTSTTNQGTSSTNDATPPTRAPGSDMIYPSATPHTASPTTTEGLQGSNQATGKLQDKDQIEFYCLIGTIAILGSLLLVFICLYVKQRRLNRNVVCHSHQLSGETGTVHANTGDNIETSMTRLHPSSPTSCHSNASPTNTARTCASNAYEDVCLPAKKPSLLQLPNLSGICNPRYISWSELGEREPDAESGISSHPQPGQTVKSECTTIIPLPTGNPTSAIYAQPELDASKHAESCSDQYMSMSLAKCAAAQVGSGPTFQGTISNTDPATAESEETYTCMARLKPSRCPSATPDSKPLEDVSQRPGENQSDTREQIEALYSQPDKSRKSASSASPSHNQKALAENTARNPQDTFYVTLVEGSTNNG